MIDCESLNETNRWVNERGKEKGKKEKGNENKRLSDSFQCRIRKEKGLDINMTKHIKTTTK